MKRIIVAGNWKMNLGNAGSRDLASAIKKSAATLTSTETWIAPSSVAISEVASVLKGSQVRFGAQNAHWEESGAFTAEVAPGMLKELGCSFVIIGHSERRHLFHESTEMVAKRLSGVLKSGLAVILCVGETIAERERNRTMEVVTDQLRPCVTAMKAALKQCVIAYEPVWAIGTGKVASTAQISETHQNIQDFCEREFLEKLPLLYGGSVTPDNFAEIIALPNVNGGLVGGASLNAEKFSALLRISERLLA